jgi:hypothetical protein
MIADTNYNPPPSRPQYGIFYRSAAVSGELRSAEFPATYDSYEAAQDELASQHPDTLWVGRFIKQLPENYLEEIRYDYLESSAAKWWELSTEERDTVCELANNYDDRGLRTWKIDNRVKRTLQNVGVL